MRDEDARGDISENGTMSNNDSISITTESKARNESVKGGRNKWVIILIVASLGIAAFSVLGLSQFGADTDFDGLPDSWEAEYEITSEDANSDSDGDGLSNAREYSLGTNPILSDSDGDTLNDYFETENNLNPLNRDSDGDNLDDNEELLLGTDPLNNDTDSDQLTDDEEILLGTNPLEADSDHDGIDDSIELDIGTDPMNWDCDNDKIPDGWEYDNGLDPLIKLDAIYDDDDDGLSSIEEFKNATDPFNADSDGDAVNDGIEVALGTDPNLSGDAVYATSFMDVDSSSTRALGDRITNLFSESGESYIDLGKYTIDDEIKELIPDIVNGYFALKVESGVKKIVNYIPTKTEIVDNITDKFLMNVEMEVNVVTVCIEDHTIGFTTDTDTPIFIVGLGKYPAFFNDMTIKGVTLRDYFWEDLDILSFLPFEEVPSFREALGLDYQIGSHFLFVTDFEYKDEQELTGDVLHIFDGSSASKLMSDLAGEEISEDNVNFLEDILSHVDMELILMAEGGNEFGDATYWLILSTDEIDRDEAFGMITLDIHPSPKGVIIEKLGLPPMPSLPGITVLYAVTNQETPVVELLPKSVPDVWDWIENGTLETRGKGIDTNGLVYTFDAEKMIEGIKDSFMDHGTQNGISVDSEQSSDILSMVPSQLKDFKFGLLLDADFVNALNDQKPIREYTAIVIFPDYPYEAGELHYLNIKGVVFDANQYFPSFPFEFPIIICDEVSRSMAENNTYTVKELYDAYAGDQLDVVTHVSVTNGELFGTSLKTLAEKALAGVSLAFQPAEAVKVMVSMSPVDVGAYVLSQNTVGDRYVAHVFNAKVGKVDTFIGEKRVVNGFFVNSAAIGPALDSFKDVTIGFNGFLNDIFGDLFGDTYRITGGFIVAYEFAPYGNYDVEVTIEPISDFIYETAPDNYTLKGDINVGTEIDFGIEILPKIQAIVTTPEGNSITIDGVIMRDSLFDVFDTPALTLNPASEYYYKIVIPLGGIEQNGTYHIDVRLMAWNLQSIGDALIGSSSTEFEVEHGTEIEISYTYFRFLDDVDGIWPFEDKSGQPWIKTRIFSHGSWLSRDSGKLKDDAEDGTLTYSEKMWVYGQEENYILHIELTDEDIGGLEAVDISPSPYNTRVKLLYWPDEDKGQLLYENLTAFQDITEISGGTEVKSDVSGDNNDGLLRFSITSIRGGSSGG